ncbi:hypothetical protein NC796_02480 [Aliifodinibius sp. S!AR15-10]|uniref:hypothetical protein n=1 Tax=Aliifodinibius sp. S!AR15-10 TaxID=2950437 RepID=UPI0028626FDB|nr:hypothetical protein [Aliifodinibius sp. S!AR15-10]MDR8389988.1 hypothetical protein [Aliifodinibius sp. S!AR15-10]
MPETLENKPNETQDRDYATCLQELEQGLPIFGRISGTTDGLKQVEKELPFNFRQPFNVVKAIFKLEPGLYSLHTGIDEDIVIGFRIDGPGEQPDAQAKEESVASRTAPENYYQQRALRLEGELHDGDRKIRQLVDEIMGLKRQLSEDKTATLLTHQKELADLKESHRNEIDRLKEIQRSDLKALEKELGELEKVKFRMEMEQRAGGRDAGSRMLDMLQENAPMFFTVVSQLFAGQTARNQQLNQPSAALDISEEEAQALAESLKNQLEPTSPQPQQPDAHLNKDNHPKGAAEGTPRHLPADDNSEDLHELETHATLNGMFGPPHTNGHTEPTISL